MPHRDKRIDISASSLLVFKSVSRCGFRIVPVFLCGLISLLMLGGCSMIQLKQDLAESETLALVSGSVATATTNTENVLVALFEETETGPVLQGVDELTSVIQNYVFLLEAPSRFSIAAFQDLNGDNVFDRGEPVGVVGWPEALEAQPGQRLLDVNIELNAQVALPAALEKELVGLDLHEWNSIPITAGEIVTLADERFAPSEARDGMWAPLTSIRKNGCGIYMLEPYDPGRIPVLFVHGIAGSPRSFKPLIDQLDLTHYQAWIYQYPSGMRLQRSARVLARLLGYLYEEHTPRTVFITAHSMGGLVARSALLQAHEGEAVNAARSVGLFVTFSTPWDGHGAAKLGVKFAPAVVPAWIDMKPGSDFLNSLQAELQVPHHLFFGFDTRHNVTMPFSHDSVVSVASQLAPWAQERACRIYGYDFDHSGILSGEQVISTYQEILDNARLGSPCGMNAPVRK